MNITTTGDGREELLFDWKLDVERLEREAREATQAREPNDWTLAEAECSKDLIAAELKAMEGKTNTTVSVSSTIQHLRSWEIRVDRVIRQLRALQL